MRVFVNRKECIGCGACFRMCGDVFMRDSDKTAIAINEEIKPELEQVIIDIKGSCPMSAIIIE